MQEKSKCGIFKPKKCLAISIVDYTQTEPYTHKIAAKHPQWAKAMQAKFDALQRQHTRYISPMKMEIGEGDLRLSEYKENVKFVCKDCIVSHCKWYDHVDSREEVLSSSTIYFHFKMDLV